MQWQVGVAYRDAGRNGGGQIKTAWAAACRRAGFPGTWREWKQKSSGRVQRCFLPILRPHDLRHTAASWHYAIHRDLLALQAFGGWANISQVQVYTHLLPSTYAPQAAAWLELEKPHVAAREAG
jgi:integrase